MSKGARGRGPKGPGLDEGRSAITSADDRSNFRWWREREIVGTTDPSSIGHYASHGCIRLFIPDVKELYDLVPVGTHVLIYGARPGASPPRSASRASPRSRLPSSRYSWFTPLTACLLRNG
jgi:hypothetical protein